MYGWSLIQGNGDIDQDVREGRNLMRGVADDDSDLMFLLGVHLVEEGDSREDRDEGRGWLNKAVRAQEAGGDYPCAKEYLEEHGL